MKKLWTWTKRIVLALLTLVLVILIPIGGTRLYETIRASFLDSQEKQREDLDRLAYLFQNEFAGYEVLPNTEIFKEKLAALRQKVQQDPDLDPDWFNMEVIKTIASFKDPHTGVYTFLDERFPFSLQWSEGHFYLMGGTVDEKWLGARVLAFENTPGQEVYDRISAYTTSPNEAGTADFITYFTRYTEPLFHEGILSDKDSIELEVTLDGQVGKLSFASMPSEAVRSLPDYRHIRDLEGMGTLPLYLRQEPGNYWYEYLEEDDLFYLKYSYCIDQGDIEIFWEAVFDTVQAIRPGKFVVDVRGNPGGDAQSHVSFLTRLQHDTLVNRYGSLFTLIDGGTSSAAVNFANNMERLTEAVLVGEKTNDIPNTTSDPTYFTLPHSGIQVILPNLYAFNSHIHDKRDAVLPQIPIPQKIGREAYFVDEVLDSIKKIQVRPRDTLHADLPDAFAGTYSFSPLRNAVLRQKDGKWEIAIDGLLDAPLYRRDSLLYTRKYDMRLLLPDSSGTRVTLHLHNSKLDLQKLDTPQASIEELLADGDFETAKTAIGQLKQAGELPYYLDRPYFQSKVYSAYNEHGIERAFELNTLALHFYPDDPVVSIIDFELHQYQDDTAGQIRAVFPITWKLLKRYYSVITTERVMNDDYNAFIGSD